MNQNSEVDEMKTFLEGLVKLVIKLNNEGFPPDKVNEYLECFLEEKDTKKEKSSTK